jgi:hypothetical protein
VSPADQTAEAELAPPPPGGRGGALDPELVVLAPPPQTQRMAALTVMAAAVVALMALAFSLVGDMAYALHAEQPRDLGSATTLDPKSLASNTFVRMSGVPTVARAVQFRQGFGTVHRVFAPAGQHTVYVRVQERGGESFVRSEFTGRLVTFGELGPRYAELAKVMQQQHMPVSSETGLPLELGHRPALSCVRRPRCVLHRALVQATALGRGGTHSALRRSRAAIGPASLSGATQNPRSASALQGSWRQLT